jgi:CSLREA domain-containing protein
MIGKRCFFAGVGIVALLLAPGAASAASIDPNTTVDENTAVGSTCSLREAIIAANTDGDHNDCSGDGLGVDEGHDTIHLAAGANYVRSLTPDTNEDANLDGDLDVFDGGAQVESLSIFGNGAKISGTGIGSGGRVLHVLASGDLTLVDVEIEAGRAASSGGGGILNLGTLFLSRTLVTSNTSDTNGGGIENAGTFNAINSTIEENFASLHGGGLNNSLGTGLLNNVTVANNQADTNGDVTVGLGGGIRETGGGPVSLRNTIVAGNFQNFTTPDTAPDCSGGPTSLGWNLIGSTTGCGWGTSTGDVLNPASPGLGFLAQNGGDTRTVGLMAGSPAIDAGNPGAPGTGGSTCEGTDQRFVSRPLGPRCDIGAFEGVLPSAPPPGIVPPSASPTTTAVAPTGLRAAALKKCAKIKNKQKKKKCKKRARRLPV